MHPTLAHQLTSALLSIAGKCTPLIRGNNVSSVVPATELSSLNKYKSSASGSESGHKKFIRRNAQVVVFSFLNFRSILSMNNDVCGPHTDSKKIESSADVMR